MGSERVQRQIDRLLDEAEKAFEQREWIVVRDDAQDVLGLDPANQEALTFLNVAQRALGHHGGDTNLAESVSYTLTPAAPSINSLLPSPTAATRLRGS